MARYVPDIHTHRWIVLAPVRSQRPDEEKEEPVAKKTVCPFCYGHEDMTPPESLRWGDGEPNKPGWLVRVVPNKFAITDVHEVIIHSPDHTKDLPDLSTQQVELILKVYRERYKHYAQEGQVLLFCNYGKESGASLIHPHSQLVVIPRQIKLDTLSREPVRNVVEENTHFTVYCPDFSQWPYEVWITPKKDYVFDQITDEQLYDLAPILQGVIKKLHEKFPDLAYNYYIHPGSEWYLRVMPRTVIRAGFELGTGLAVNIADPTEAATFLRQK
ncbi:MAG TPA: DUF4931 domain-containing protein [Patescibacteria group bacterium]|nr:DUF4931 domain-containing protein [Patescibacteria group bacterium]